MGRKKEELDPGIMEELRQREEMLLMKEHRRRCKLVHDHCPKDMPIENRLVETAKILHERIQETALTLAAMEPDEVQADYFLLKLCISRSEYVKNFLGISKELLNLSVKLKGVSGNATSDEAQSAINRADAILKKFDKVVSIK